MARVSLSNERERERVPFESREFSWESGWKIRAFTLYFEEQEVEKVQGSREQDYFY